MTDITIPREALEAGELVLLRGIYGEEQRPCADLARAAFLAMIKAWPEMAILNCCAMAAGTPSIILPLPKEPSNG